MWTTVAIVLLSISIILLGYSWLLQKWHVDALQQVLEAHIMMDTQMNQMNQLIMDITEEQRKEQSNEAVKSD